MKSRVIVIFALVFLTIFETRAQSGLFGIIKDSETNELLIGAAIYNDSLLKGTATDENGYYELILSPGKYRMRYSYLGYKTIDTVVTVSNTRLRLNIKLKKESLMLQNVIVSSKKRDANVRSVDMSIQKLDMVAIRKIPALLGEVDVIKAIQMMPGVQAASEGSSGYSVRGGTPDQNLIILDDAPVYNASHILGFFSIFNNDIVKDATLYKGDVPTNYESRLSSVLDVKTLDEVPDRFTMTGGIGILTSRIMLDIPFNKQQTSIKLAGRITYGGLIASAFLSKIADSKLFFYDLNGKISHTINKNNRIHISAYNGQDYVKFGTMFGMGYGNTTVTGKWIHIFNDKLSATLTPLYSKYGYNIDMLKESWDFGVKAGIEDVSLKYDFIWLATSKLTTKFGLSSTYHQYLIGELDDRSGVVSTYMELNPEEDLKRKTIESAVYFSNEHEITPFFSLRYGLRFSMCNNIGAETLYLFDDQYNWVDSVVYKKGEIFNTYLNVEPRIALKYQIGAMSSIKASYSRTVQYAQLASASTAGLPFEVWFPSSPNVKPQKCDQFAAGYFRNFRGNDIETSVEVFYKHLTDVIDFVDDAYLLGNALIDGEVRAGKGRSYGIELQVNKNFGKLTGWVSYTYSRSFRTIKGISHDEEYRSPYDRPHNINIVVNYAFTDRFDVSATWVYSTGQPVTMPYGKYTVEGVTYSIYNGYRNQNRYPDYHRLDLSATLKCKPRKRWRGEWNFSIYNAYARHNTWAITFTDDGNNNIKTENMYLFSIVPSVTYNFKF